MRNYLILLILSLFLSVSGCGPVSYLADLALKQGEKMLRPKIKCEAPQYNISIKTSNLDLMERYQLATKETGCFSTNPNFSKYILTPVLTKTRQNQALEVRLYHSKSIIDIHAYPCNSLNLQDKVDESVRDILLKISQKGTPLCKKSLNYS